MRIIGPKPRPVPASPEPRLASRAASRRRDSTPDGGEGESSIEASERVSGSQAFAAYRRQTRPPRPRPSGPAHPSVGRIRRCAGATGAAAFAPARRGSRHAHAAARPGRVPGRPLEAAPSAARRCARCAGPAPFLGSNAIAISPDGRNVYVASSRSDAIAIFRRDARTGALTQRLGQRPAASPPGARGGCAQALGLDGPNSVAVSADGQQRLRHVARQRRRRHASAATRRPARSARRGDGSGCIANAATPGCATGRALDGPDVVAVSPDGSNVYVGVVRRQRGRRVRPRRVDRRADAAVRRHRLHRQHADRPAAPPASRWRRRRAWRSAPTATTSTSRPRAATPLDVLTRDPSTRRADAGDRRHRLHRRQPARRLHDRHCSSAAPTRWRSAPTTTTST